MSDMLARLAARAQGSPAVLGRRIGYRFEPAIEHAEAWPGEATVTRIGDALAGRASTPDDATPATPLPGHSRRAGGPRTSANGLDAAMRGAEATSRRAASSTADRDAGTGPLNAPWEPKAAAMSPIEEPASKVAALPRLEAATQVSASAPPALEPARPNLISAIGRAVGSRVAAVLSAARGPVAQRKARGKGMPRSNPRPGPAEGPGTAPAPSVEAESRSVDASSGQQLAPDALAPGSGGRSSPAPSSAAPGRPAIAPSHPLPAKPAPEPAGLEAPEPGAPPQPPHLGAASAAATVVEAQRRDADPSPPAPPGPPPVPHPVTTAASAAQRRSAAAEPLNATPGASAPVPARPASLPQGNSRQTVIAHPPSPAAPATIARATELSADEPSAPRIGDAGTQARSRGARMAADAAIPAAARSASVHPPQPQAQAQPEGRARDPDPAQPSRSPAVQPALETAGTRAPDDGDIPAREARSAAATDRPPAPRSVGRTGVARPARLPHPDASAGLSGAAGEIAAVPTTTAHLSDPGAAPDAKPERPAHREAAPRSPAQAATPDPRAVPPARSPRAIASQPSASSSAAAAGGEAMPRHASAPAPAAAPAQASPNIHIDIGRIQIDLPRQRTPPRRPQPPPLQGKPRGGPDR